MLPFPAKADNEQHKMSAIDPRRIALRFGSVNYRAEVWLSGECVGQHEGGHLPFEFDVTSHVRREGNLLGVRVDGEL